MRKLRNHAMFVPTLIYFAIRRNEKRRMYELFKQLAYKKWSKWQWDILDSLMREEEK